MKNDIEAIRKAFRQSEEARYIHRLHGVLLVLRGLSTVEAGKLLGDPQRTISHWMIQFKKRGLDGLHDGEKSGRPQTLNPAQTKVLVSALRKSPHGVGLSGNAWTGALVSAFLDKRYGIKLTMRHCRRILRAFEKSTRA